MSLLMDALKKAEQEKKEAAKRQEKAEGLETSQSEEDKELRPPRTELDDTDTWGQEIVDGDTTSELPTGDTTGKLSSTSELELEPMAGGDDTAELPDLDKPDKPRAETDSPTLNVTMGELTLAELSDEVDAVDAVQDVVGDTPSPINELQSDDAELLDETFHGVALDTSDINSELFQETVQGEAFLDDDGSETWGETLPGIPATQLAEDIGSDDQPTPVAAQTVFAASETTRSRGTGFRWALGITLFLLFASASVLYYNRTTPINRNIPSPQIARGIEQVGPSLHETLKTQIESAANTTTTTAVDEEMSGTLAGEESTEQAQGEAMTAAEEGPRTAEKVAETGAAEPQAVEDTAGPAEGKTAQTLETAMQEGAPQSDMAAARVSTPAELPEQIRAEPSLIRISRSKVKADTGKTLQDAFVAYQKGAYGTAAEKYQETLEEFPDNRDALLGLAAIAFNSGDHQSAFRYYARVLQVRPGDKYARAALINLQDRSLIRNSESVITTMLHDNPDAHYLHFTLGNIYASYNRWAEAQQAFFDAYRLNSASPDYALNLAVSLDHIGQYDAALDYYNTALELASNSSAAFEVAAVSQRIEKLAQATEATP